MKLHTIILLTVAGALILLGATAFVIAMTLSGWNFEKLGTARYETNTYTVTEEFNSIVIQSEASDVELLPSDNGKCRIICYENRKTKHGISTENGILKIMRTDNREWYDHINIFSPSQKITVYLPMSEYKTISVKENTGDVKLPRDFRFESIDIETTTGDIELYASCDAYANLETTTGDISVKSLSLGALEATVSTGNISIEGLDCQDDVKLICTTGDVYLSDVSCGSLESNGSTGDITLKNVLASNSFDIERRTGYVKFYRCDASQLIIKTTTGNVDGSLRTAKIFIPKSTTGNIRVPNTTTGGICEINVTTGNINIRIEP